MKKRSFAIVAAVLTFALVASSCTVNACGWRRPRWRLWPDVADYVVISSVQADSLAGSGGSSDDWIELYNPTSEDIDLAAEGYRIERARTAADPSIVMRIGDTSDGSYPGGTVIPAYGYYLIVRDDANEDLLAKADAIGTRSEFTWTGHGYTLYLGDGPISSPVDENIVDFVGFGSDAVYYEGSAPAPAIPEGGVIERKSDNRGVVEGKGNGYDTNNNVNDFVVRAPNSQNSKGPTERPSWCWRLRRRIVRHIVISEIQIDSIAGSGGTYDDWIELYNPTWHDIDLAAEGYRIERATASGGDPGILMRFGDTADGSYPGGTVIPAYGYYLIVRDDANEDLLAKADAIGTRSEFTLTDSNVIYIGNDPISSPVDENIVDFVGYDAAPDYEGTGPAPAPPDGGTIERKSDARGVTESKGNAYDTNNNVDDFVIWDAVEVQNSESSTERPPSYAEYLLWRLQQWRAQWPGCSKHW